MISTCAYTILPSCAEKCASSILTVMSGGLIPIVSDFLIHIKMERGLPIYTLMLEINGIKK